MQNAFLIGPTVYLRPLERGDAPQLATWLNDPEVNRTLATLRPICLAAEETYLSRLAESQTDIGLGIMVRQGDQFVGTTGLHNLDLRNRQAAFGICVGDKTAWGNGYATEATHLMVRHAFRTLNLHRVWLHVYEFNPRAVGIYERVGFRVEGRLRQDVFREGRYWDTLVMGILHDEWTPPPGMGS